MRNIPENNLAIPVYIELNNGGSGSGFLVTTTNATYFITAKHVIFDDNNDIRANEATLVCQTEDINDESTHVFNVDLMKLLSNKNILTHQTVDIVALKISNTTFNETKTVMTHNFLTEVIYKQRGNGKIVSTLTETILLINDVLISNDVFVYGYPSSLGLRESPQFDYTKPLLRKGIVANINKKSGTIILDCPVYYGNSGGPVMQVTLENGIFTHNLIGVVSQFIPFQEEWINTKNRLTHKEWSNSGYSVAVAMDFVFDMLGIKKV